MGSSEQIPSEGHVGHLQPVINQTELIKDDNFPMNFRNLDWGRLENCKSNEKRTPPRFSRIKNKIQQTPPIASPLSSSSKQRLPPRLVWPRGNLPPGNRYHHVVEQEFETSSSIDVDDHFMEPNDQSDGPYSCPFPLPPNAHVGRPNETRITPLRRRSLEDNSKESKKHDLFSFSLGKMGKMARSHSLKENNTTNHASPDSVKDNRKKPSVTNPSRTSPLRRLLDPLLKPKGPHLAQKVHKPKLEPTPSIVALMERRSSNVKALLQLKLKNGIPYFKFVVEGSNNLLAAAVKKLPSVKDDSSLVYAFYSVHETKKKSGGWMHQTSKEKSYCFEYSIVGQMKISSAHHGLYAVRESVLCSTETTCADQETLEGELAAIIVKNLIGETCGDIGSSKATTVVLPDCVHSWPNSGLPSPLISRWRSGGGCDCGSWDMGCQFRVLTSHHNDILKTSTPSTSNHLDLSYQARGDKNKCSFRLVPVEDGLYSVEYDSSMSLLQAFSIGVAVVSSHKLTHIFEVSYVPDSKDLSKAITIDNYEKVKSPVSKPPASPVARGQLYQFESFRDANMFGAD